MGTAMKKAIICDIDGTLADCRHRLYHVLPGGKRDWDSFFAGMGDDGLIEPVADLIWYAHDKCDVVLCSGRPEDYRAATEAWLDEHNIKYDALYMSPAGDTRADHIVKAQLLAGMREDGYEPFIVIDDRQSVVDMWREAGLVCLQAAPADPPLPATVPLVIMVGPSGGGKSALVAQMKMHGVISSDEVRADMCGDFRDQSKNVEVFAAVHALVRTRLKHNLPTIIDATHLRRKDRMAAAALANGGPVIYMVVNRPMAIKRAQGGWRNDARDADGAPFDLIGKHEQTFRSQLKDILRGDGLENVTVFDMRTTQAKGRPRDGKEKSRTGRGARLDGADAFQRTRHSFSSRDQQGRSAR